MGANFSAPFALLRPVEVDPLKYAEQYQNLANLAQLRQYRQQEMASQAQLMQENALKLENMRRDQQDQQILTQAYADANGDPEKMFELARGRGASIKGIDTTRKAFNDTASALAKTEGEQLDNRSKRHDLLNARLGPIEAETDPAKQEAAWNDAFQQAIQAKEITPEEAAEHPYPGVQGVKDYRNTLNTDKWVTAQATKQRAEAQEREASVAEEKLGIEKGEKQRKEIIAALGGASDQNEYDKILAEYGKTVPYSVLQPFAGKTPEQTRMLGMTSAEQQKALADVPEKNMTEAQLAWTAASDPDPQRRSNANDALKRLDQSKREARPVTTVTIPGLSAGSAAANQDLHGEDYLATLPASTAAQIRQIANGDVKLPPLGSRGVAAVLRDAVFHYDPTFNEQRAQLRKSFAGDKQIGNLNTAVVHLDQFADAAKALGTGTFRPGNAAFNALVTAFGGKAPTNFEGLKTAVAGEMAAALKGTATDVEIGHINAAIEAKNSPEQLQGYINEMMRILGAKMKTYQERFQQVAPGDTIWTPVLPSARAVFNKFGIDPMQSPSSTTGGGGGRGGSDINALRSKYKY